MPYTTYEDGTVFRNVRIQNSDGGESRKRKNTKRELLSSQSTQLLHVVTYYMRDLSAVPGTTLIARPRVLLTVSHNC